MNRSFTTPKRVLLFIIGAIILLSGCKSQTVSTSTSTLTTITSSGYSQAQLEYRLFSNFPNVFWCDPDFYPIARAGQEQQNAIAQFPAIKANQAEYSAILAYLNLQNKTDYTDNEKLLIYKEHKKLNYAVQMTYAAGVYNFDLRVGDGQGERIQGTIKTSGEIQVTSRSPSFNSCPICLVKGTLIDTPEGPIPVERLIKGMIVWTLDGSGNRIAKEIVETASTPTPLFFQAIRIELSDGRSVTASPGHPSADGRAIADYQVGDEMDGARIIIADYITYKNEMTYDILPAGITGL